MRGRRPAGGAPEGVQPIPQRSRIPAPSETPVERLELAVLRRLDGLLAGDHAGLLPGHGTERGEARPYVAGDDPRHIDWAVTARTGTPHVRDTIADHELELWLVLDRSASMGVGTGRSTKHELAWSVAGAFALLATGGGNRIGAVTCGRHQRVVPARSGRAHVAALLAALREPPVDRDDADLGAALQRTARSARRRGMVVVVSDFLGAPGYVRPLRALAQRHDVVAVEVTDPRERTLPDVGLVAVEDPETGRRRLVDTHDAKVRAGFDAAARRRREAIASSLASAGVDHLVVSTERDWVLDVVRFVSGRQARRQAARPATRKAAS
ncbi:MAG: DUF58 domain-containing protein [Ilumatobacteraceae bacterium]|nr:DUF58 domain-containing protein [Ilumatobacteraceae bacterium]